MDVPRRPRRRPARWAALALGSLLLALVALGVGDLRPAVPSVSRASLMVATVKRGAFERAVRAAGRLVPRETRWVTAITPGRVEEIAQEPGAAVHRDSVILKLQNPDVMLARLEADRDVTTAQAAAYELETRLGAQGLDEEATVQSLRAQLAIARRRADAYGAGTGLVPRLDHEEMEGRVQSLSSGLDLARRRRELVRDKGLRAIAAWREQLSRRRAVAEFHQRQVEALSVRAGAEGILVDIAVEPGQWAAPGAVLASVVQPDRLKAELDVPELLAKDVQLGMAAEIDTHNGTIDGRVSRVAAAARDGIVRVEVALEGALPAGARPQLSVDGVVLIETLPDALYVDRPASVYEGGAARLYRISADQSHAERVVVDLGRASALSMEVKRGLAAGDRIIVSDTSDFPGDRVALR